MSKIRDEKWDLEKKAEEIIEETLGNQQGYEDHRRLAIRITVRLMAHGIEYKLAARKGKS